MYDALDYTAILGSDRNKLSFTTIVLEHVLSLAGKIQHCGSTASV
jgi:hypothetical protein